MKKLKLLVLSGLFLSNLTWSTANESWTSKSTERQFDKTSGVIYKKSKDSKANVQPLAPSAQSKIATGVNTNKNVFAKTLTVRPEAKAFNQEFWIFDAWVEFYSDNDSDSDSDKYKVQDHEIEMVDGVKKTSAWLTISSYYCNIRT